MFSLRSFFGFTLSVLVHGSVGAYLLTHDYKAEKPKPKKMAMRMAMFKITPPPLAVVNPVLMAPSPKPVEKTAKPASISPPPKQTVKPPVKEIVTLETPKPALIKPPKIETKPKPATKEKVAVFKPIPKPLIKVKPKLKKKVKKKIKLKKKNKIFKPKTVIVKKKPKTKPRIIAPSKRKAIVKKRINKKPPLARKAKAPTHRPSPRKVALKRVVRHTNAQQRAPIKKHGRPKTKQSSKPIHTIKSAVRTKPATRLTATKPRVASNPHLERQYEQGIRQRIEQKKVYPRRAKRMRKQGVVKVAFSISRNGTVSKLRIVKSSGVKSLDKAALSAVKKVGRFPAIPAGIHKSVLSYIIPIAYRIR